MLAGIGIFVKYFLGKECQDLCLFSEDKWWTFLHLDFYLRLMTLHSRWSWFVITTSASLRKSVATKMVFGVAKSEEGCLLQWQTHVYTVDVFSKVKKQKGTSFIKRMEISLGKIGDKQVLRWPVSIYPALFVFALFHNLNTHQSQGNLPTPPLPNARWLWGPCQNAKATQTNTSEVPWLWYNCVVWTLGSNSILWLWTFLVFSYWYAFTGR